MIVRGPHGNIHPREIFMLGRREDLESPPLPDFVVQWTAMEDAR
jgi:hypothetical protein